MSLKVWTVLLLLQAGCASSARRSDWVRVEGTVVSVESHAAQPAVPWPVAAETWVSVGLAPDLTRRTDAFDRVFGDAFDPKRRSVVHDEKVRRDGTLEFGFVNQLAPEIKPGVDAIICWDQLNSTGRIWLASRPGQCPDG